MRRFIGVDEIEDMALGATVLGAGGGGDPYVGKLMAIEAIRKYGDVELITPDEVPDDAVVVVSQMMGAPTIMVEKICSGLEPMATYDEMVKELGVEPYAIYAVEAGGVNSTIPFILGATRRIPVVDCDLMGRAFPELQMATFAIGGASASPMAFIDEKGNAGVLSTVTNKWTEDIARAATTTCGGTLTIALYCMDAPTVKAYGVHGIVTRSQKLGHAIRTAKEGAAAAGMTPEEYFLHFTGGFKLFKGKIADVLRETRGAFNFGRAVLEGIGEYRGSRAFVDFQNENLQCVVDGEVRATVPDLICLVDPETFIPVPTDALKYGKRVLAVGLTCFDMWRTPRGLDLVGPRYFGIDVDYVPVEELCGQKEE